MTFTSFESNLKKYADLIVKIGLNLQPGQRLLLRAPIESAPLARALSASAYESGSRLVDVIFVDEQLNLVRFQHAPRDSFEEYHPWREKAMLDCLEDGGALFSILGESPDLLQEQDPKLVSTARKMVDKHMKPIRALLSRGVSNWSIVSYPVPNWANKVFPDLPVEQAVEQLWEMIFFVCRLDRNDPVTAWQEHIQDLVARCEYLNSKQYDSLKFSGPGTDLRIGLVEGHIWQGGRALTERGLPFTPNLPTEEIFTMPHKERVEGVVHFTKPRSYSGNLIEDFSFTFRAGRVVEARAAKRQAILEDLIDSDEGAARLGEVALVPNSSPISQSGLLFYNALLDENAASHIAIGNAYKACLTNGEKLSDEEFDARGGNTSMVHVDLMIGSGEINVDGITHDGVVEPLMRAGEWAFDSPEAST